MITIIQGTNRPDSRTEYVSRHLHELISVIYDQPIGYVSMADIPAEVLDCDPYDIDKLPAKLTDIQDALLIPATKFIWITPEYNGSFPGILKLFIDSLSVRHYDQTFPGKKSSLIGITTGRSGNIRGLDHLASVLLHMKGIIYPWLLPISRIGELMDAEGHFTHDPTIEALDRHIRGFINF